MVQFEKDALVIRIPTDQPRHKLYEIQTGLLEILQRATADTSNYPEHYSLWKIYDLQKELIPEPEMQSGLGDNGVKKNDEMER